MVASVARSMAVRVGPRPSPASLQKRLSLHTYLAPPPQPKYPGGMPEKLLILFYLLFFLQKAFISLFVLKNQSPYL